MDVTFRRLARVAAVALVVAIAFLVSDSTRAQPPLSRDFLVTGVRVFDGVQTLQNTQVAVAGGIVRAVGDNLVAWRHLANIDGAGSTLIPGLIDAHAHVVNADDLRQSLRFGVSTVLDMATLRVSERDVFALRSAANTTSDIADLRSAGFPATAPGAHGTEFAMVFPSVGTVPEAKQFVASRHAEGSDYLKLILNGVRSATAGVQNLDEPRVKALVDAAHAAGMLAVAHVETLDDVEIALSAGIDGLMHVWRRGGANPEMARRLRERNVFVVPALAVPDGFLPEGRASLLAEPRFASVISKSIRDHLSQSFLPKTMPIDSARGNLADQMAAVRSLHAAGVKLLVGTDASPGNPTAQGISVHREIELLKEAGLRPSEILTAVTSDTAEAFHLLDRGRILPGRRADLVLIRGNPTSDLSSVRDIARVWKAGVEMDRSAAVR